MDKQLAAVVAEAKRDFSTVVVYGANCQLTEITLHALRARGVEPAFLADGRLEYNGARRHGLEVLSPERLAAEHPDAVVFIALTREFWTVYDMLWEKGMTRLRDVAELLDAVEIDGPMFGQSASFLRTARDTHARLVATRRGQVSLPFVNFVLTERCSLNCRACNNLMPLVRDKRDYDKDKLLSYAGKLTDALDVLVSATIIGGEAFLYGGLPEIISGLSSFEKITKVEVVTNGTMIPREPALAAMAASPKVHVTISEYPGVRQKMAELTALFAERGIPCDIGNFTEWRDMGGVSRRGRTAGEIRRVFRDCAFKNCPSIVDGKLYRCSRSAFGTRLGFIPPVPAEYIDLDNPDLAAADIREKVKRLFIDAKTLSACDYCDGGDVTAPSITAAEQA